VHELSLAESVARIACAHAGERRVTRVAVKVGHLRQVVPAALTFAFGLVAEGTVAEGAELALEEVAPAGRCRACGAESALAGFPLACARCGGLDLELLAGEELLVDWIELEDDDALTTSGGTAHGH
jgi:hydrogenase nickel incorporation protein HypA/HybF